MPECSERELLQVQLAEYATLVRTEHLRLLCDAADAWACEATGVYETVVCSDKGLHYVPADDDAPGGGRAG